MLRRYILLAVLQGLVAPAHAAELTNLDYRVNRYSSHSKTIGCDFFVTAMDVSQNYFAFNFGFMLSDEPMKLYSIFKLHMSTIRLDTHFEQIPMSIDDAWLRDPKGESMDMKIVRCGPDFLSVSDAPNGVTSPADNGAHLIIDPSDEELDRSYHLPAPPPQVREEFYECAADWAVQVNALLR